MATAKEFIEAMRERTGGQRPHSVEDHWQRQKQDWLNDLDSLRADIERWLAPAVAEGWVKPTKNDYSTSEPDLGHYMAPGLVMNLLLDPPVRVELRPRGARVVGVVEDGGKRIVGARGRVDLESGVSRVILLRFKDDDQTAWVTFTDGERKTLDESLFYDLLSRIGGVS